MLSSLGCTGEMCAGRGVQVSEQAQVCRHGSLCVCAGTDVRVSEQAHGVQVQMSV